MKMSWWCRQHEHPPTSKWHDSMHCWSHRNQTNQLALALASSLLTMNSLQELDLELDRSKGNRWTCWWCWWWSCASCKSECWEQARLYYFVILLTSLVRGTWKTWFRGGYLGSMDNETKKWTWFCTKRQKAQKSVIVFWTTGQLEHLEKPNTKIITKSSNFSDSGYFLVVNSTVYTKEPSVTQQHQFCSPPAAVVICWFPGDLVHHKSKGSLISHQKIRSACTELNWTTYRTYM